MDNPPAVPQSLLIPVKSRATLAKAIPGPAEGSYLIPHKHLSSGQPMQMLTDALSAAALYHVQFDSSGLLLFPTDSQEAKAALDSTPDQPSPNVREAIVLSRSTTDSSALAQLLVQSFERVPSKQFFTTIVTDAAFQTSWRSHLHGAEEATSFSQQARVLLTKQGRMAYHASIATDMDLPVSARQKSVDSISKMAGDFSAELIRLEQKNIIQNNTTTNNTNLIVNEDLANRLRLHLLEKQQEQQALPVIDQAYPWED